MADYVVLFRKKGSKSGGSKYLVSAPCIEEAMEAAKKQTPPEHEIIDVSRRVA